MRTAWQEAVALTVCIVLLLWACHYLGDYRPTWGGYYDLWLQSN